LTHVLSERNIAPARPQWGKYSVFRRAGAKNVSRHPTTPHAGAVFLSPQLHPCPTGGTKFTLLVSISVQTGQKSPSTHKTRQKGPFRASRASFVPEVAPRSSSRANFVPAAARSGPWWRVLPRLDTARVTSCRSPPTHAHRSNVACNFPINLSHIEIASLQFQRFQVAQKTHLGELHATFRSGDHSRTTHSPADGGVTCAGAPAPDNRPPHAPPPDICHGSSCIKEHFRPH